MEYAKCNLCNAGDTKFIFRARCRDYKKEKEVFNLVKCKKCGLVYLNPRPDKEEIKKYYHSSNHLWTQSEVVDIKKTRIWGIPWREAIKKKAEPILRYKKIGRILDVGCGDGSLLSFLKELGWQTSGVELHERSSLYAREVLGLNVFSGRLEEANYPGEFFDVIILFHVLEHLSDPSGTLKKVRMLLRKDGFLLIKVPNFDSFESKIFRSKWVGISIPLHLYHFSPCSLKSMLENCGFIPQDLGYISEKTRYLYGYSESLRFWLRDLGLYPLKTKEVKSIKEECMDRRIEFGSSWSSPLKLMEYLIFKSLEQFVNKIGRGSNLLAVARKT